MSLPLPPAARDLINKPTAHALVVTTNKDGSPHATLVWVEEHDGRLTFNTATGRRKWFNLRRNPHILVVVQDPAAPGTYAVFEGTATLSEEGANEQIDRLSKKYTGRETYDGYNERERRVSIRVDIAKIAGVGPWID
ncbi:MAG: PPOX class F420-dependent oxidoreductase [Chloroflexi bacterium]|nr:PPOX class F420-dependent oxidoreductase [Chloroflexota bacterium]